MIRDFIQARSQADDRGGEPLEQHQRKIVDQFFPARGEAKLNQGKLVCPIK